MRTKCTRPLFLVPEDSLKRLPEGLQYRDQLLKLLDVLLEETSYTKERRDGDLFPFHSRRYRELFGSVGNEVVKQAEAMGLIDRPPGYVSTSLTKKLSQKPRATLIGLRDQYRDGRFGIVEPNQQPRHRPASQRQTLDEVSAWLLEHLPRFKLPERPLCANALDALAAKCWLIGRFRAMRCEAGRFHSTMTRTSRVLRSQMWLDQCRNVQHIERDSYSGLALSPSSHLGVLWEVDLATCQPLLTGAAACNEALYPRKVVYEWLELCQSPKHDLYLYIASETGSNDRDAAKEQMMRVMFGTVAQSLTWPAGRLIKRRFPSIWKYLLMLKAGNHRNSARFAQHEESSLMIDGVCVSLMRSHPDIPIATVHDSVLFALHHLPVVRAAILAAFRPYGLVPRLKEIPVTEVAK